MELEFKTGDVLVMIGTNLKSKVRMASSGWRCYYLDHYDEDGTLAIEYDEISSDEVEREYVLVERDGGEDE